MAPEQLQEIVDILDNRTSPYKTELKKEAQEGDKMWAFQVCLYLNYFYSDLTSFQLSSWGKELCTGYTQAQIASEIGFDLALDLPGRCNIAWNYDPVPDAMELLLCRTYHRYGERACRKLIRKVFYPDLEAFGEQREHGEVKERVHTRVQQIYGVIPRFLVEPIPETADSFGVCQFQGSIRIGSTVTDHAIANSPGAATAEAARNFLRRSRVPTVEI